MNGVLIIDKPSGLTSHDVVNRARRILGQRSIGHLGTLDPMATGILPLVAGNFTRLAQFYVNSEKTYEGTIHFGFSTDTYDAEGEPTSEPQIANLRAAEIEATAARFRGVIQQTPPPFSAKKIKGVAAYKLARKQKEVILHPVEVEIKEFDLLGVEADRVHFRAHVSSGTYMRSVAHDMGKALGCGAHLESLRRTTVAEFGLSDAHTLEELAGVAGKLRGEDGSNREPAISLSKERKPWTVGETGLAPEEWKNAISATTTDDEVRGFRGANNSQLNAPSGQTTEPLDAYFIHPRKLLPHMPAVTADEATAARIRAGRTVNLPDLSRARQVKVFSGQRDLIAIATRVAGTLFHAKIVLCG